MEANITTLNSSRPDQVCEVDHSIEIIIFHIALIILAILAVALNGFVLYAFFYWLRRGTPSCWILISLAVSDFITGFVVIPTQVITSMRIFPISGFCKQYEALYAFSELSNTVSVYLSTLHVCALTIDRYLMICYPIKHTVIITESKTKFVLLVLWVSSVIFPLIPFTWISEEMRNTYDVIYSAASTIVIFILPLLLVSLLFPKMITRIYCWSKNRNRHRHRMAAEYKAAILFLIMYITFVISIAPIRIIRMRIDLGYPPFLVKFSHPPSKLVLEILVCMRYVVCVLNPAIYTLRTAAFKNVMQPRTCSLVRIARCSFNTTHPGYDRQSSARHRHRVRYRNEIPRSTVTRTFSGSTEIMSFRLESTARKGTVVDHEKNLECIEESHV